MMKPSLLLFIILIIVLAVSAVVTPFVQALIDFVIYLFPALTRVSSFDFDRVMSRVLLVTALVFLWLFRKRLLIGDIFKKSFPSRAGIFKELRIGAGLGVLSLIILIAFTLYVGVRRVDLSGLFSGAFMPTLIRAVTSALVVALIEELFFRGFILQILLCDWKKIWAAAAASFFYSIVHFTKIEDHPHFEKFDLLAGFKTLGLMIEPVLTPGAIFYEFIGLFIVGMVLAYGFIWTRGLYLSIGLHAGWIFVVKMDSMFVMVNQGWRYHIYGTEKMIDGYISWIILLALLFLLKALFGRRKTDESPDRA